MRSLISTLCWRFPARALALLFAGLMSSACASADLLRTIADVPLPGAASRFDYQSLDARSGLLYIAHMGDGHVLVFDTATRRVVADLTGFPGVTGVRVVPVMHRLYVSATGRHAVAIVDTRDDRVRAWVHGARFPDGIAYAKRENRVFVSDELGGRELVIDAARDTRLGAIPLPGEAGNVRYDPRGDVIYVAVQTRNELVAVDPRTLRIIERYPLPVGRHPHGLLIDGARRLAFIACDGDATLLVFDLTTRRFGEAFSVGNDPDVLSLDDSAHRLYVASESGVVSVFAEQNRGLRKLGDVHVAAGAHSILADPRDHRVYLPLANRDGRPVLRIMAPGVRP